MPRAYRKRKAAPRRRKGKGVRRSRPRAQKQMAQIQETIEFNRLAPNTVQACTFSINQFQRAKALAVNFRWYKPTSVTWKIEPQFGTYQAVPGGATVPYLYQLMNRTQDSSFMTLSDMLTQGCRPSRLVAAKSLSYRPNWCSPGLIMQNVVQSSGFGGVINNVAIAGMQAQYGWLQAPNEVNDASIVPLSVNGYAPGVLTNTAAQNSVTTTTFNGHQYYVEQQTPVAGATPTYKLTCTVKWSFKDPKNIVAKVTDNIFQDISGAEPEA